MLNCSLRGRMEAISLPCAFICDLMRRQQFYAAMS